MFNSVKKILVVAAHADDETLGCGGTIIRAVDQGIEVGVVLLGEGISARFNIKEYDSEQFRVQTSERTRSMNNAFRKMGVSYVSCSNRLCTQFDTYPLLELVKEVEFHIEQFKPDVVLTHSDSEINIDHKLTFNAVETAVRPIGYRNLIKVYSFEVICSGIFKFKNTFNPNFYVDITNFHTRKLQVWSEYCAESRDFPFPRSDEGLLTLAKYRGMQCGVKYAEAFRLERELV